LSEVCAIYGQTERVCAFVAAQPGFDRSLEFGECQAIGFTIGNSLVAGAVFQNFDPITRTMEISAAATDSRWMTRKSLQHIFGYVFDTAGCQLCILRVSEDNERMRSIARRLGFTEYLIPRLCGPETAGAIYTLSAEQWAESRIRSSRVGQAESAKAA
jgi:RimJ/RimL family protein N-acetyltransferase